MADNSVFITGIADSAFVDALGKLPPWATESTAYKIQGILEKTLGIQNKMLTQLVKSSIGNNRPNDQTSKINKELDTYIKNMQDINKDAEKTKKLNKDKESAIGQDKKRTAQSEITAKILGALAAVGDKVYKAESKYITVYDDLYKSGVNLLNGNNSTADGFQSLNQMVNLTGLQLETLQKVMREYSSTLNALGPSKFTKALAQAIPGLKEIGFSSKESADLMATYIESQAGFSDIRNRNEKDLSTSTIKFGEKINKMSLALGLSREQLLDNIKTGAKSSEVNVAAAVYGDKAAENINNFASSFKDAGLADMVRKMGSAIDPVQTDAYRAMQSSGGGDIADRIGAIITRQRETGDTAKALQEMQNLAPRITDFLRNSQGLTAQKSDGVKETIESLVSLKAQFTKVSTATDVQTSAAIKAESAIAGLQTEVDRTKALAEAAFFPTISDVTKLGTVLRLANDEGYKLIDSISAQNRSIIGATAIIAGFVASLAAAIGTLYLFNGKLLTASGMMGGGGGAGGGAAGAIKGAGVAAAFGFAAYEVTSLAEAIGDLHKVQHREGVMLSAESKKRLAAGEVNNNPISSTPSRVTTGKITTPDIPAIVIPLQNGAVTKTSIDAAIDKGNASSTTPTPAIPVKPAGSDINSKLDYQNTLLEQLVSSQNANVSVNKDILKYTKIS